MEDKRETRFAYALGIALFLIGAIAYAAWPEKTPEQPIRMVLKSASPTPAHDPFAEVAMLRIQFAPGMIRVIRGV